MTDYSRDRLGPDDEDRLPWLEPVEEELEEGGIATGRLVLWAVAALVAIGLIVGGFFWMRHRDTATAGDGALIKAPDSYYKERPAAEAPATGDDEIVYSASKGNEVESTIDTSGTAETPVNVNRQQQAAAQPPISSPAPAAAAPKPTPAPAVATAKPAIAKPVVAKPAAPPPARSVDQPLAKQITKKPPKPKARSAPAKPAPAADTAPASGHSIVQLGAFSSEAKANTAWKNLSGRFSFLSGLAQSIVPVQSGDKTLYRLRASGGNVGDICRRLKTAGESCSVIG